MQKVLDYFQKSYIMNNMLKLINIYASHTREMNKIEHPADA